MDKFNNFLTKPRFKIVVYIYIQYIYSCILCGNYPLKHENMEDFQKNFC